MDLDLKNRTLTELEELAVEHGGKKYLGKYVFSFIHDKGVGRVEEITPLPKALREKLVAEGYSISQLKTMETFRDPDGTVKFLFELGDGHRIESVLLVTDTQRQTLCISSQAGCRMGCDICATGQLRFKRNLSAGEIADQVNQAERAVGKINNVVYMGMGEPFDNYNAVMRSLHILNHHTGKNIGQRHITVSTCGLCEGIERFAYERLQVRLAISLHAVDDAARQELMPVCHKYPLPRLLESIKHYQQITGRRVMFEYCLIEGVNDNDRDAKRLIRLLEGIQTGVNLIEFNPYPGCAYRASSRNRIQKFKDIVSQGGIETIVRYKRGQSIRAACGQLGADWLEG